MNKRLSVVFMVFLSALPFAVLLSCTADATPRERDSDGGSQADSGADRQPSAVDAARPLPPPQVCTTLVQRGALVGEISVAAAPPAMTGGPIEPGTYVLTLQASYTGTGGGTGPTGVLHELTMQVGATTIEAVQRLGPPDAGGRVRTTIDGFVITDGGLLLTAECPDGLAALLEYGAGDGGLSLLVKDGSRREVWTLERLQ